MIRKLLLTSALVVAGFILGGYLDATGASSIPGLPWLMHQTRPLRVVIEVLVGVPIAFGHWASLGLVDRPDLLALDTGCVWGRSLTAARVDGGRREIIQVDCA